METATQIDKGHPVPHIDNETSSSSLTQPSTDSSLSTDSSPTTDSSPSTSSPLSSSTTHKATNDTTSLVPHDVSHETDANVIVKHGGAEFKEESLLQDHTIQNLESQIKELTNVKVCRQRPRVIKRALVEVQILEDTNKADGMKLMMVGGQERVITPVDQTRYRYSGPLMLKDEFDARIPEEPLYMADIAYLVEHYKVEMLNQPRPDKKLLVLDIDYTLITHCSTILTANESMRPFLHEFLMSAYVDYDIVIWSAASMRYIETKMADLRVSSSPFYKIAFYLDCGAMISVDSQKYGCTSVKPLAVIWGKFPGQYTPKNTIMLDDLGRNFLMNPQNGLQVKAYRDAWKNRDTDEELSHLSEYLSRIARMDNFSALNHKNWQMLIDRTKRHKTSPS